MHQLGSALIDCGENMVSQESLKQTVHTCYVFNETTGCRVKIQPLKHIWNITGC